MQLLVMGLRQSTLISPVGASIMMLEDKLRPLARVSATLIADFAGVDPTVAVTFAVLRLSLQPTSQKLNSRAYICLDTVGPAALQSLPL